MEKDQALPLEWFTPDGWAEEALGDPLALLNDHAHLEKKAAANALDLVNQWPDPAPPEHWVERMTAIARDEVEHLAVVCRILARRGGRLTKHHRNPYASDLRSLVRPGQGQHETMDRLMVSALIEARSCERFEILSRHCNDVELRRLYRGLWRSERGHYLSFVELARDLPAFDHRRGRAEVEERWKHCLREESRIIQRQSAGPRMHSAPSRP